jgi:CHAT domain-containing protein
MKERDVVQVPSAGVLVLERARQPADSRSALQVIAISASAAGLSGARTEVRDLARHYRHVDTLADLSGPDAFAKAAGRADVLHIASHALLIDRSPWWSGIELRSTKSSTAAAPASREQPATHTRAGFLSDVDSLTIERTFPSDPYVRAWQIATLDVPARLAVLSACETAGGRMTTGEGTLGLTAAFLSAGVPVVVSSLWPVDDRVTATIMHSFYGYLASGQPVATALRRAQIDASHSSRYAHPFYWAGFTVVGDGSMSVPIAKRLIPWNPLLFALAGLVLVAVVGLLLHRRRARAFVG